MVTSEFDRSDLELTFRQPCTAEQTDEVVYLDVKRCTTTEDDHGFVTKDFARDADCSVPAASSCSRWQEEGRCKI